MSMSAASDRWNPPIPPDDNLPDSVDDEALGPCGCTEYHMADCDIRDRRDWDAELEKSSYDPYYDDPRWEGER